MKDTQDLIDEDFGLRKLRPLLRYEGDLNDLPHETLAPTKRYDESQNELAQKVLQKFNFIDKDLFGSKEIEEESESFEDSHLPVTQKRGRRNQNNNRAYSQATIKRAPKRPFKIKEYRPLAPFNPKSFKM